MKRMFRMMPRAVRPVHVRVRLGNVGDNYLERTVMDSDLDPNFGSTLTARTDTPESFAT